MYPKEYRYTRDHEWVKVEDDICVVGVTDFAQQELGEVVYVEVPEPGQVFNAHDEIGTIESVKAVADIFTPVAGEIVELNEELQDSPDLVNRDPYGDGWFVKIAVEDPDELDSLMDAEAYRRHAERALEEGAH